MATELTKSKATSPSTRAKAAIAIAKVFCNKLVDSMATFDKKSFHR